MALTSTKGKKIFNAKNKNNQEFKTHENNPGITIGALKKIFGCGKTLRNKDSIMSLYLKNVPESRVFIGKIERISKYSQLPLYRTGYNEMTAYIEVNISPRTSKPLI